jgi:acetyl esterase
MPIDAELAAALEARNAAANLGDLTAMRAEFTRTGAALPRPEVGGVSDHAAPARGGGIPVRLYRPHGRSRPPLLIFLHGGGWMFGDLDSHDAACRRLVVDAGCAVAAVAYRLAPEHPFPAALEDCRAAVEWLLDQAEGLGLDAGQVGLGGESAGANLAAVLARQLRTRDGVRPMLQLLIHPLTDFRFESASIDEVQLPGLNRNTMTMLRAMYLPNEADILNPDASPALATDLAGSPPATVLTVEIDPLRDEGETYALQLARAGVETTLVRLPGLTHGFMFESTAIRIVDDAFRRIGALVRRGFAAFAP